MVSLHVVNGKWSSKQRLCAGVDLYINKVSWFCRGSYRRTVKGDNTDIAADAAGLDYGCLDIIKCVCSGHNGADQ